MKASSVIYNFRLFFFIFYFYFKWLLCAYIYLWLCHVLSHQTGYSCPWQHIESTTSRWWRKMHRFLFSPVMTDRLRNVPSQFSPLGVATNEQAIHRRPVIVELPAICSLTCAIGFQGRFERWWTRNYKTKYRLCTDVIFFTCQVSSSLRTRISAVPWPRQHNMSDYFINRAQVCIPKPSVSAEKQ